MKVMLAFAAVLFAHALVSCHGGEGSPYLRKHHLPDGPRTGWLERVLVCPGGHALVAKLDTGAKTSSLHVTAVDIFDKEGRTWVRFTAPNRNHHPHVFERELVRMIKIKERDGTVRERPVVKLGIVLADTYHEVEVNLENRATLNYRLLLGRTYLQQAGILINSGATFRTKPNPARVPSP